MRRARLACLCLATGCANTDSTPEVESVCVEDSCFELQVYEGLSDTPASLEVGDVDLDGALDVVISYGRPSRIGLYYGVGDGSLEAPVTPQVEASCSWASPDPTGGIIAFTDAPQTALVHRANAGEQTLAAATTYAHEVIGGVGRVFDMDADGHFDLVRSGWSDGFRTVVAYSAPEGGFVFGPVTHPIQDAYDSMVAVGDVNGDGLGDVITSGPQDFLLSLWLGTPHRTLASGGDIYVDSAHWGAELGDLDSDGELDLITLDTDEGLVRVVRNEGGVFNGQQAQIFEAGEFNWGRMTIGDLDGDGHLDALVSNPDQSQLRWLRGDGQGRFDVPIALPFDVPCSQLKVVDLDDDGRNDLLCAGGEPNVLLVARGLP